MKKYEFDADMRIKDMFAYMLRQQYGGLKFFVVLFVGAVAVANLIVNRNSGEMAGKVLMIILLAFLFVVYPLQLLTKAAAQVKISERFQGTTHYVVDEEGIVVSQGGESLALKYGHLYNYKKGFSRLYVYTGRATAFIFPKAVVGEEVYAFLLEQLKKNKADFMTLPLDTIVHTGPEDEEAAGEKGENNDNNDENKAEA